MLHPKFPIYVISKGRHDCALTADFLVADGVPFHLVVEPQEQDLYVAKYGAERVYVLPFSNLGLGGIPARNWVWEHAKASGAERHWILDDNIRLIYRNFRGKRLPIHSGVALAVAEQFFERYENIAIGGLNYYMFVHRQGSAERKLPPFYVNNHVYSCLCIRNDLEQRWRGRYNEDTDLCLQVLAAGWCTVLLNAFSIAKMRTMTMKGGNATELYKGDGRLVMSRSLERVWPGVVETKRKFQRPQHHVKYNWARFDTPLRLKAGVDLAALPEVDEFGMKLHAVKPIKSAQIRQWVTGDSAPDGAKASD